MEITGVSYHLLCILIFAFSSFALATDKSVFDGALAVCPLADLNDSAGNNSRLTTIGEVEVGIELKGSERKASLRRCGDGYAAWFGGGWCSAGQGADGELNLTGKTMTVCIRLCDP